MCGGNTNIYLSVCPRVMYVCVWEYQARERPVTPITIGIQYVMPGTDIEYVCMNTHTHTHTHLANI